MLVPEPTADTIWLSERVEILLNLAWAALAISLVTLWLRAGSPTGRTRRSQVVAIAVLIAILFPIISVSDDLMAMQSPNEISSTQRRGSLVSPDAHPHLLTVAAVPPTVSTGLALSFLGLVSPGWASVPAVPSSLPSTIQNRPPPQS